MISHTKYIFRCIELGLNGAGFTYPNPMVGAVIVHNDIIIGEGFHHTFGEPHAEVIALKNCIENGNEKLLNTSTLYVNLEPCSHSGKTPPCTDLIIKYGIPKVVIGCNDPFPEVNGMGVKKMLKAGIEVVTGVLADECVELNRRFITFHTKKRPYIILKFAQTANHMISQGESRESDDLMRNKISNLKTDMLVHKWRSEEAAIMVGTKTAETDNPKLTVRNWNGKNPLRIVIDRNLKLKKDLNLFDGSTDTLIINEIKDETKTNLEYLSIDFKENVIEKILDILFKRNILSVLVEGGSNLLQQFIDKRLWDEARIITSDKFFIDGIRAPEIHGSINSTSGLTGDKIVILRPA